MRHARHVEPYLRNEDRAFVVDVATGFVVCVVDGAGGIPGGAAAADLAAARVGERASSLTTGESVIALLRDVDDECERNARVGEAACVVVVVAVAVDGSGVVEGASVGDCEAWIVRGADVEKLTAGQHRKRRLGCGVVEPVRFASTLSSGDALVVGSDGLFGFVTHAQVVDAASAAHEPAAVVAALLRSAQSPPIVLADDFAAIVVRR